MSEIEVQQASIVKKDGQIYLKLWHDKGLSVYRRSTEDYGSWVPVDSASRLGLWDLIKDME